ncbi:MAG: PatB family C-S lyase [Hydrogenovibrio sp.]|nr:PatB family C-S lyase [Hydrogenovibrio sp.]
MNNFDRFIDRTGTHAEKYDRREALFGSNEVLPMWVADMDLPTPDFILEALKRRLEHPLLGYTVMPDSLYQAIIDWQSRHGYSVKSSEILFTHNVANGFFMAVSAFTRPGEAVLVQTPVYPPFLSAPELNDRVLVEAPLVLNAGRYEIDFQAFEQAIVTHDVKLFLFCHPQNPSGRVWRQTELERLAEICLRHGVVIVSDEIHADMTFTGNRHLPMAALSAEVADITVTLSSPGKIFNLGGLQIGYAIIANPALKAAYRKVAKSVSIQDLNLFAMIALQAGYSPAGAVYREQLLTYLEKHIRRLKAFMSEHFPDVHVMEPEASYLVWLDFRAMFDDHAELKRWLIEQAKLGLNDGLSFGEAGRGFMRMNLAVPSITLDRAFAQLRAARARFPG